MSDEDRINQNLQLLMQGVVDFGLDFSKKMGMPPAATARGIASAAIGLSCKDVGVAVTVQWLHDTAAELERVQDPNFIVHPPGKA